jgi:hypothetical protein
LPLLQNGGRVTHPILHRIVISLEHGSSVSEPQKLQGAWRMRW